MSQKSMRFMATVTRVDLFECMIDKTYRRTEDKTAARRSLQCPVLRCFIWSRPDLSDIALFDNT